MRPKGMTPDFFLVGAPRSGTTALCNYLRTHPEVFVSSPKEPTFFGRDLLPKRFPTLDSYLELFSETGGAVRAGDGSVAYLASEFAAEEIHDFNPKASILMVLRNPVDMIFSLHRKHYLMGIEPCRRLEDALAAESARLAKGAGVPDGVCPKVIALRNRASYVPQLKRFFDVFPAAQIKLFLFDDFQANPDRAFRECCQFLGVREDIHPHCGPHNVGREVKCANWHEFLTRTPRWGQLLARVVLPFPEWRKRTQQFLVSRNHRAGKSAGMSDDLRSQLKREFAPEVAELSKLVGWDLSHWSN
jgi:hypothetical protein